MKNESLTLTIVIPVYNEERYIKRCLDSIASQTVKPDGVIIVDNNSSDKSLEIAKKYSFVKILHEKKQHQVFAQATGFNVAKSDILGRIDGDSVLPAMWVEKVKQSFDDDKIVAITGGADPYDVPARLVGMAIFHGYIYIAGLIAGTRLIWGANCAIRASAWSKVRNQALMRGDIWEDYDLAFCLKKHGRVKYVSGLVVGVSFRAIHTSFTAHARYQFRSVRTFYYRANPLRLLLFVLLWTTTFLVYPLAFIDDIVLKRSEKM